MIEAIAPASMLSPGSAAAGSLSGTGEQFSQALRAAEKDRDREALRESAGQLVSSAFIVPVLNALRESPFLEEPFAPTFAEKRFAPLLDQQIADRIVSAANFPLVDVIVDRLLGTAGASVSPSVERTGAER